MRFSLHDLLNLYECFLSFKNLATSVSLNVIVTNSNIYVYAVAG